MGYETKRPQFPEKEEYEKKRKKEITDTQKMAVLADSVLRGRLFVAVCFDRVSERTGRDLLWRYDPFGASVRVCAVACRHSCIAVHFVVDPILWQAQNAGDRSERDLRAASSGICCEKRFPRSCGE